MKEFRQGHWHIGFQKRQVFDVMDKKIALKRPITFPVLQHLDKIVMSATPQEVMMMKRDAKPARGNALVAGLGLGIILKFLRPKCDTITVVEKNEDVIKLYRKYAGKKLMCDKIAHESIEANLSKTLRRYDYIHLDTWYVLQTEALLHVNYLIKLAQTALASRRGIIRAWGLGWMRRKFVSECVELWETSRINVVRAKEDRTLILCKAYPLLGKFITWLRANPRAKKGEVKAQAVALSVLAEKSQYPLEYADDINKMLAFQEEPIWKQFQQSFTTAARSATGLST